MVLVTGATGFLGSYLVKNLVKRGEKVRALKRRNNFELLGNYAQQVEWVEGDLLDVASLESALSGIEKVYHCAAIVSSLPSKREIANRTNAEGTANLFNAALANGKIKKVLHVSSTTTLGLPLNHKLIDENYYAPTNQLKFSYFKAKRFAEMEAWRANAEGLDVVIVNPSGLMGAGHWHHEPLNAFPAVYNGLSFYMEGSNGFIDIRDCAELMVQLMESNISGERFILSAENIQLKDLLFMIADAVKVKRPSYKVNGFMSEVAWRYETIKSAILNKPPDYTRDDIRIARTFFKYDNSKVLKATGFKFRSIAESVNETARHFLESHTQGKDYSIFD